MLSFSHSASILCHITHNISVAVSIFYIFIIVEGRSGVCRSFNIIHLLLTRYSFQYYLIFFSAFVVVAFYFNLQPVPVPCSTFHIFIHHQLHLYHTSVSMQQYTSRAHTVQYSGSSMIRTEGNSLHSSRNRLAYQPSLHTASTVHCTNGGNIALTSTLRIYVA